VSEPPPPTCRRCGEPADAQWLDITTWGDPEPVYLLGQSVCPMPGCVDEFGSRTVPPPDVPGELTHNDRMWLERQRRLVDELGALNRQLMEAM
jgi:hypothetical protein